MGPWWHFEFVGANVKFTEIAVNDCQSKSQPTNLHHGSPSPPPGRGDATSHWFGLRLTLATTGGKDDFPEHLEESTPLVGYFKLWGAGAWPSFE
jgi:hypothetical protein